MLLTRAIRAQRGFTLVEVVLTVVIIGILTTVVLQTGGSLYTTAKVEETKQELDALAYAMVGNPHLQNNGVRSDFGYVGDIGALPADLDALVANPGGYGTWRGPYFQRRFSQITDDHRKDAWGNNYEYSAGVMIKSVGKVVSGGGCGGPTTSGDIIRHLAGSASDLLLNRFTGIVYDADGTPPGDAYDDSVLVRLTVPDGTGSTSTKSAFPDRGGYFSFDSIPIGNHNLEIVYLPQADTLRCFVSILPSSSIHLEYRLATDVWME